MKWTDFLNNIEGAEEGRELRPDQWPGSTGCLPKERNTGNVRSTRVNQVVVGCQDREEKGRMHQTSSLNDEDVLDEGRNTEEEQGGKAH